MAILTGPLTQLTLDDVVDGVEDCGIDEGGVRDGSSPNESFDSSQSTATRTFHNIPWDNRVVFVRYALGEVAMWQDSGDMDKYKLTRTIPLIHPELPEWVATKVSLRGMKWTDVAADATDKPDKNVFKWAVANVTYEHVPFIATLTDADTETEFARYVEYPCETQASAEVLTLPGAAFYYVTSGGTGPAQGKPVPFNNGKQVVQSVLKARWHRIPEDAFTPDAPLYKRIYVGTDDDGIPYLGTVNENSILGCAPGTLLFSNVSPVRRRSPTGAGFEYSIEYEFTYKSTGWLNLYYADPDPASTTANGYYFVSKKTSGALTYYDATDVPDGVGLYNTREFADLWDVN